MHTGAVNMAEGIGRLWLSCSHCLEQPLPSVEAFAKPLDMPFIHRARKPSNQSFLTALSLLELPREQVVMVGDQLLTDVLEATA